MHTQSPPAAVGSDAQAPVTEPPVRRGQRRSRRGSARRWLSGILLGVTAATAALLATGWLLLNGLSVPLPWSEPRTIDRSGEAVQVALLDLQEFRAATGRFQVIVDLERDVPAVPAALAGERVLFVAAGSVDATVDFSDLDAGSIRVDEARRRVSVNLPPATLTDAEVDPRASYVFERQRGLLDRLGGVFSDAPTSERELYLAAADKLSDAAVASDLRATAERNTTAMLEGLLGSLGFEDITVTYGR